MKVGDIVVPIDEPLTSGASYYSEAVVVQEKPLVLVSMSSDMRWEHTIQEKRFYVKAKASPEQLELCERRL